MDQATVLDRLGPPTRSTSWGELKEHVKKIGGSVVTIGGVPSSDPEAWLYVDTPPGHNIQVTIRDGRLEKAEVFEESNGKSDLIWSTDPIWSTDDWTSHHR